MDALLRARRTSLLSSLKEAGWNPDPRGTASNPARLWVYSVSYGKSPRLVTQIGAELYRDMLSSGGLLATLAGQFASPGDALADALREYDGMTIQNEQSRQALTLFLAFYACSTKTWSLVKPLSQVDGAHFFVFDWLARDSMKTVLRPAHHHQPGPMQESEITALFNYVLQAHLTLHPADIPQT